MRDKVIDQLKGFGILLILINHTFYIPDSYIYWFIQSFHVPLFFIISGYLYKKRAIKETAQKKFYSLMIPYISFLIFYLIIYYFGCALYLGILDNQRLLLALFHHNSIPINGNIWFLFALFMCAIIYSIIDNYIKKERVKDILIVSLAIICFIYTRFTHCILPLCLNIIPIALLFYLIGTKLKTHKNLTKISINKILLLLIFFSISVYFNGLVDMYAAYYSNEVLYLLNSIIGTVIFWSIFNIIKNNKNIIVLKTKRILEFINKYAIVYICTNQILIATFKNLLPISNIFIKYTIIIVLVIILGYLIDTILSKTKLKIVLGKK